MAYGLPASAWLEKGLPSPPTSVNGPPKLALRGPAGRFRRHRSARAERGTAPQCRRSPVRPATTAACALASMLRDFGGAILRSRSDHHAQVGAAFGRVERAYRPAVGQAQPAGRSSGRRRCRPCGSCRRAGRCPRGGRPECPGRCRGLRSGNGRWVRARAPARRPVDRRSAVARIELRSRLSSAWASSSGSALRLIVLGSTSTRASILPIGAHWRARGA